jgi:hypothetical protein
VNIDHGAMLELVLAVVGWFCEINGMRPPDVLSMSSCLQQLLRLVYVSEAWTVCAGGAGCGGSLGGGPPACQKSARQKSARYKKKPPACY